MPRLFLLAFLTLTACGADGAPEAPTRSGLSVSGDVEVGVVVK
jgi:hypothetical protein